MSNDEQQEMEVLKKKVQQAVDIMLELMECPTESVKLKARQFVGPEIVREARTIQHHYVERRGRK